VLGSAVAVLSSKLTVHRNRSLGLQRTQVWCRVEKCALLVELWAAVDWGKVESKTNISLMSLSPLKIR